MKFSVIVPMYNSEKTIINALESVRKQTVFKYIMEIIIVNDGSTDASLEIVNTYRNNNSDIPIIIINKENGGVSSARNMAMQVAKADWIALLDSDDEWVLNKIEIQTNIIENNLNIDFLGGDINELGLNILWRKIKTLYKANLCDLCLKVFPQTSTAVFKKMIYEEIGGYDETQKYGEDINYFMKICKNYNYYHVPIQLVLFGGGKRGFGVSGLSADLRAMHSGNIKNIKELRNEKNISLKFYWFLRCFYFLKYIRRILITESSIKYYKYLKKI